MPHAVFSLDKVHSDTPTKPVSLTQAQADPGSSSGYPDGHPHSYASRGAHAGAPLGYSHPVGAQSPAVEPFRAHVEAHSAFARGARTKSEASLTRFKINSLATAISSAAAALYNVVHDPSQPWSVLVMLVGTALLMVHLTSLFDRRQQAREAAALPAISRATLTTVEEVFAVRRRDTSVLQPLVAFCSAGALACIVVMLTFAHGWMWSPAAMLGLLGALFILLHTHAQKRVRVLVQRLEESDVKLAPRTTTDLEAQLAHERAGTQVVRSPAGNA